MIGWENLEFHPLADLFPMMSEDEQSQLADSIERDGFDPAHAIVLYEGKILDGRNRWLACMALHREGRLTVIPNQRQFVGDDPVAFVVRENLNRRHLSASQRAALAVDLFPQLEEEARRRQAVLNRPELVAKLPQAEGKGKARDKAAGVVNVSPRYVQEAKSVSEKAPDLFEKVRSGEATLQDARRELRRREQPTPPTARPLPAEKYSLILADPPWQYEYSLDSADEVENHYPTQDLEWICSLPIEQLAADNCVLFLWATSPKLEDALRVVRSWGFRYRTSMIWEKNGLGMGYYARINHELLLICTRGEPGVPLAENRPASVVRHDRSRHSEKPDVFREIIEQMYPSAKRIELFCRAPRRGWEAWGNDPALVST